MTPREAADLLLAGRPRVPAVAAAEAYAPANIALAKYWGKRDEALNLPTAPSLSVSLGPLGSHVRLSAAEPGAAHDGVSLNGAPLGPETAFARRASAWLDLVRPDPDFRFELQARNTVPTAAGFASSASGFAALAKAADALFGWNLPMESLSVLARLGSGSAARSLADGFVEWRAGERADGMDSFGVPLPERWPSLRVGACVLSSREKPVGSREGMRRSVSSCPFYGGWPGLVARDLAALRSAIANRDMALLGATAEANCLAMHALMLATRPPILYALPETLGTVRAVWAAREEGVPVWFTMDAGPNVKLLFEEAAEPAVRSRFPGATVVAPFA
ncbi:MAG: diphosphomevalonate decarboxylase [Kiritimatiellae bacterium]|nr:diphosphomevalonate decarboxylase [Kiritimatiellia bacterium]